MFTTTTLARGDDDPLHIAFCPQDTRARAVVLAALAAAEPCVPVFQAPQGTLMEVVFTLPTTTTTTTTTTREDRQEGRHDVVLYGWLEPLAPHDYRQLLYEASSSSSSLFSSDEGGGDAEDNHMNPSDPFKALRKEAQAHPVWADTTNDTVHRTAADNRVHRLRAGEAVEYVLHLRSTPFVSGADRDPMPMAATAKESQQDEGIERLPEEVADTVTPMLTCACDFVRSYAAVCSAHADHTVEMMENEREEVAMVVGWEEEKEGEPEKEEVEA